MNKLLTGTNSYLGKKLKEYFLEQGYNVTCLVKSKERETDNDAAKSNLSYVIGDLIHEASKFRFPNELNVAYYFSSYTIEEGGVFQEIELLSLQNYIKKLRQAQCPHLIYVVPLRAPVHVDILKLLKMSYIPYTIIRTSNIIGIDSPLMRIFKNISSMFAIVSNKRLAKSRCQPIALKDALECLEFLSGNPLAFNQTFDLGGPDTLSYQEMIEQYLKIRGIKRKIIILPFFKVNIPSFWFTKNNGISTQMARAFNKNIKGDILCSENQIDDLFPTEKLHFKDALKEALREDQKA